MISGRSSPPLPLDRGGEWTESSDGKRRRRALGFEALNHLLGEGEGSEVRERKGERERGRGTGRGTGESGIHAPALGSM